MNVCVKHPLSRTLRVAAVGLLLSASATIASSAVAQNAAPSQNETRIVRVSATPDAVPQHISLALNKAAVIELDRDARAFYDKARADAGPEAGDVENHASYLGIEEHAAGLPV